MFINGVEINLKKIGIDFELNNDQVAALNTLATFLEKDNGKKSSTLSGAAGTGKTACVRVLLQYLRQVSPSKSYNVVLAAPTHKAKVILKRLSGSSESPVTLHSLLSLRPNVNILEFDAKNIEFYENGTNDLFLHGGNLFIVDEAGMLNDDLYEFAVEKLTATEGNKVLFIGDSAQLRPVGQTEISKVFTSTDEALINLTKVERIVNGSVVLEEVTLLRDSAAEYFETIENDVSGIIVYDDTKNFMRKCRDILTIATKEQNPDFGKILAFQNKRVKQFNLAIMKALGFKDFLSVGAFYMGGSSFEAPHMVSKRSFVYKNYLESEEVNIDKYAYKPKIYDGGDYVLLKKVPCEIAIPYFQEVKGFFIEMLDTVDQLIHCFYVLDPDLPAEIYRKLGHTVENLRLRAIDTSTPYKSRKSFWSMWYSINNSFVSLYDLAYEGRIVRKSDFVPGYAITVHKSQGSSYNNVMIDMADINKCTSVEDRRALQYVSMSRTKSHIHLIQ